MMRLGAVWLRLVRKKYRFILSLLLHVAAMFPDLLYSLLIERSMESTQKKRNPHPKKCLFGVLLSLLLISLIGCERPVTQGIPVVNVHRMTWFQRMKRSTKPAPIPRSLQARVHLVPKLKKAKVLTPVKGKGAATNPTFHTKPAASRPVAATRPASLPVSLPSRPSSMPKVRQ